MIETRIWENPGLEEESLTCNHAQNKSGVYMCPGDNGGVYQVLDTSGGTCVFDKKCTGDEKSYQACGCPLISAVESTKKVTINKPIITFIRISSQHIQPILVSF